MAATSLLIISNGHGEDSIGAAIIRRLPSSITAEAYPTLGDGRAYSGVCPIVGPRAQLPSEGWRNVRNSIARDITGGGVATVWPGLRFIRASRGRYDKVLIIGDMIGVYGAWITGHRGIVYVDVYKTGFGKSYLAIDKWILRRTAQAVFCRAASLAETLRSAGIDARAAGNVMMDTIPRLGLPLGRTHPLALTLLPGSRAHALRNFALQVQALRRLDPRTLPDIFLAAASSLDINALASAAGLTISDGAMTGHGLIIDLVPGSAMGDALDASDFVLSQAGTATVQALGLGRPAITFQSLEDRPSRFRDEGLLFGDGRLVVNAEPPAIADATAHWLADPSEIARRGAIGRERIGPSGAIDAIIAELAR
ncbi:MAG TPA: hypothetical protein VG757_08980 [Devosia sp.]|nr:hypothetical protein [Devosia sp.]